MREPPVAGLYPDEESARQGAEELRQHGIEAEVKPGVDLADSRFGRHLARGFGLGLAIALPFAIVLPLAGWAYHHTGLNPLAPVFWLGVPILFVGGFLGLHFTAASNETAKRERSRAVVTRAGLTAGKGEEAARTMDRSGADVVDKPDIAS